MKKDRVEAISDGVMAVAITLLALDLDIDEKSPVALATQLRAQWPSFAAYVVSFFVIGTLWFNHHNLFAVARSVDRRILTYNLLILLLVAAIPFASKTYAEYVLAGGANARTAVLLYGGILQATSLLFTLMLRHLVRAGLTDPQLPPGDARPLVLRRTAKNLVVLVLIAASLIKPILLLILGIGAIAYYMGPGLSSLELRFPQPPDRGRRLMEKGRVEFFSDAVLAVAITVLALYLHVDVHSPDSLATQLREQWPSFAAFALSVFFVGSVWLQHHSLFRLATGIDQRMMVYNLVMLLFVVTVPFGVYTYADYVLAGGTNARVAVLVSCVGLYGMALSLSAMLIHIVRAGLLDPRFTPGQARLIMLRYSLGMVVVFPFMAVSLAKPILGLPASVVLMAAYGTWFGRVEHALARIMAPRRERPELP